MRPWLAALLLGCDEKADKVFPEQTLSESAQGTGHTGLSIPIDSDGDGVVDEEDCAPDNPLVFPGASDVCNGIDDNCDGQLTILERDEDGDGAMWCEDCDDTRADVLPGAEDPDGDDLDSNCDGTDGLGLPLAQPVQEGEILWRTAGYALAGGDVDGDGCDDLLIGEPGGWGGTPPTEDEATLGIGCYPWADGFEQSPPDTDSLLRGYYVDVDRGLVAVHELGWRGRGRTLVYDETFSVGASPLLEVQGGGLSRRGLRSMAMLGEPAQWLLFGKQPSTDFPAAFYLVDLSRRGVLDLEVEEPDLTLATDVYGLYGGTVGAFPNDMGDRDGDGLVDLGLVGELGGRALRFFPEVQGGHIDDAPEAWTDTSYGYLPEQLLHRGGDLDGDGRDDAFYSASFADGEREGTGRAYLLPWLGAGEYDVANDATARFDGEFAGEWFGFDTEIADIDGDGLGDLIAGAPGSFFNEWIPSKVMVFRGPISGGTLTAADAAILFSGEHFGDHAGTSVATGDFDGSGRVDIAIGAPFADRNGVVDAGAVYVLIDPL